MPNPDTSTLARRAAVGIENRIRRDPLETGALIAPDGSVLVHRQGQPDKVHLTVAELLVATGATFTHNHPRDSGPSVDDVVTFAQFGLAELRVVTATARYIVSRRRAALSPSAIRAAYAFERPRVAQAVRDDVRATNVHPTDYWRELVHRTWLRVYVGAGFNYLKEQS